jgi:hypothetical protein
MASLFQGEAPPNVTTTRETAAVAPQYLTDYLTQLAQQGQQSLGTLDKATGQYVAPTQEELKTAGSPYVAPLSQLQKDVAAYAPEVLKRYQTPMDEALAAGQAGAGIDQGDISKFYNPYEAAVVGDMATRSATNVQRNLMPQLKSGFVGTGGLGGQRYANALGQTLGDTEMGLLQEQNKYKAAGYQSALDAALKEMSGQTQAGQMLGTLGAQEQQAATTGLKTASDIGAIEQAQNQALINAPTTMASNVAQILRGYTYPTVTTEKYEGPASSYGPSILSQIGGLGSLVAAGTNATGTGLFDKALNYVTGTAFSDNTDANQALKDSYFSSSSGNPT